MSDNENQPKNEEQEQQQSEGGNESTAKKHTNKLENPESIPVAGGKKLGEDHQGESKMLSENAVSEEAEKEGNPGDVQKQLEGKKVEDKSKDDGEGEKKEGMMAKIQDKLGMNKSEGS